MRDSPIVRRARIVQGFVRAARAAWTLGVVTQPPILDDAPGVGQTTKPVDVEAFVAEPVIEALDVFVLHGLAKIGGIKLHAMTTSLGVERLATLFGPIIHRDPLWGPCQLTISTFHNVQCDDRARITLIVA